MKLAALLTAGLAAGAAVDVGLSSDQRVHVQDDPKVSHIVSFEIAQGDYLAPATALGTLEIALFASVAPVTCTNFLHKAVSDYKDTVFHRIIRDFVVQGGGMKMVGEGKTADVEHERFDDENFVLSHNKLGRLSMANAGPDTNGCQFFITTGQLAPHLDGKHVVFGQLVGGFDVLEAMNTVDVEDSVPKTPVYILKVSVADTSVYTQEESVAGYSFLMFFCVIAVVCYAVHWYTSRRLFVDLSSYKM